MKSLISLAGLDDGLGNTSSMRVVLFMIGMSVVAPKLILFFKNWTLPEWSNGDMEMIGIALTGKLIQNQQENQPTKT